VYSKNAKSVVEAVKEFFPEVVFSINAVKPKSKSFEITLVSSGQETLIWTGVKKGPPRKLKFPSKEVIVKMINAALNNN